MLPLQALGLVPDRFWCHARRWLAGRGGVVPGEDGPHRRAAGLAVAGGPVQRRHRMRRSVHADHHETSLDFPAGHPHRLTVYRGLSPCPVLSGARAADRVTLCNLVTDPGSRVLGPAPWSSPGPFGVKIGPLAGSE